MRKQDRDYNCGIFAVMYLLGFGLNPRELEKIAGTSPRTGTSHRGIVSIFKYVGVDTNQGSGSLKKLAAAVPAIVNYQWDGDGHYGVVVSVGRVDMEIYNPGTGKIETMSKRKFYKAWFSKRYGKKWFLSVKAYR